MDTSSRDERRLMRQRGAGTRNINNNIEFDLAFPTPTNARRRSKTPSTDRRVVRRVRQTPARRSESQEPSVAAPSLPEVPTARRTIKRKSSFLDAVTEGPASSPNKRRRATLNTIAASSQNQEGHQVTADGLQEPTARQRRAKSNSFIIAEEANIEESPVIELFQSTDLPDPEYSLLNPQDNKENSEPNQEPVPGKPKRRKSFARKFQRRKQRSSTGSLKAAPVDEVPGAQSAQSSTTRNVTANLDITSPSLDREEDLALTVKRQNAVAARATAPGAGGQLNRSTSYDTMPATKTPHQISLSTSTHVADQELEEEVDASALESNASRPTKKRGKRKSFILKKKNPQRRSLQSAASASPVARFRKPLARTESPAPTPYREVDENEDETYIPEEVSPEPPTPAVPKRRRNAKIVPSIESDNTGAQPRRSNSSEPRSSLPITTHRLTHSFALPTITEEEDQAASGDELNPLAATRSAPNAVDVLSQICDERVSAAMSSTRSTATGSLLKRKTAALESFRNEIMSRLFDMSAAVEHRLTLEARVRASKREKSAVQAQWIEVRSQREAVALRMDAVRREHWEGEERGKEAWALSEGLFGIGVVMQRERGSEAEGIEALIGSVARNVSGFEGGGVLQRVKDFNARLEKLVEVLGSGGQ